MTSFIYNGKVIHKRFKPKMHFFKYDVFSLLIDLAKSINKENTSYLKKCIFGLNLL